MRIGFPPGSAPFTKLTTNGVIIFNSVGFTSASMTRALLGYGKKVMVGYGLIQLDIKTLFYGHSPTVNGLILT